MPTGSHITVSRNGKASHRLTADPEDPGARTGYASEQVAVLPRRDLVRRPAHRAALARVFLLSWILDWTVGSVPGNVRFSFSAFEVTAPRLATFNFGQDRFLDPELFRVYYREVCMLYDVRLPSHNRLHAAIIQLRKED